MIKKITFGNSNCYLIKQKDNFILIDTELPGKEKELIEELEKSGVSKDNFKLVILTHGHIDHVGNATALRDYFGVRIAIAKEDAGMVRIADTTFPKAHKLFARILRSILANKNRRFSYTPFEADIALSDNQSLTDFGIEGKVVSLKGHTNGSVGIEIDKDIFVGDAAMLMGGKLTAPIFGENPELMDIAIAKIRSYKLEHIYTGH